MRKFYLIVWVLISLFILNICYADSLQNKKIDLRLYVLNCGYFKIHDAAPFFNKNFYPHRSLMLADPCFLIKHDNTWLLWDLGLGDQYAGKPVEDKKHGLTMYVPLKLSAQLKKLGLTLDKINYVILSHAHFDHTGNAVLFPHATWIMRRSEYAFIQKKPLDSAVDPNIIPILAKVHKILITGDDDIFHDGSVIILSTPGHTPGHQSLQITLPHHGAVILSGDLYHTRLSYLYRQMPVFNTNQKETLRSMDYINHILQSTHGQLIIQHDLQEFLLLPKVPNYLN